MISARDGHPNYVKGDLPEYEQKKNNSPEVSSFKKAKKKVKKEVKKVLAREYISLNGKIKSLTHFLPVFKTWKVENSKRVPDDVMMLYDATRSGLNKEI